MPNDNQTAKSYIEAVMARADAATGGPWSESHSGDYGMAVREEVLDSDGLPLAESVRGSMQCVIRTPEDQHNANAVRQGRKDFEFIAHARQDIPTLAKMLLRAIEALEELTEDTPHSREGTIAHDALLEINALAAKGSQ